jgi:type VI secretion system secreted protein VgrG
MIVLVSASNAFASNALFAATPYNVFMLNTFSSSGADTQGGLAAGGNLSINGYSVASGLTSAQAAAMFPFADTLIAGGLLTASSGLLNAGNADGATTNVSGSFNLNGGTLTTGGPQVIDFSMATTQLDNLSTSLAGIATTPGDSCVLLFGTTTCTASANNLNIIDVGSAAVFSGNSINLIATGSNVTLVINVPGTSDSLGGAGFTSFGNGVTVLFNYYQASSLALGASSFTSSVLAPFANVSAAGGSFNGTLVGDNFNGQIEFHNSDQFAGDLTSAPEPTSAALAVVGLASIVAFMRKRRRTTLARVVTVPGVYSFASSAQLTGTLSLNAQGNDNAVWVFQIGSTLTTASNASVQIINGGPNGGVNDGIFWQVGSSATLGTDTIFEGNIVALTSITLTTGATIPCGRALAENGAVTLDTNNISISCGGPGSPGSGGAGGFDSVGTPEPSSYALVLPALGALFLGNRLRLVRAGPPTSLVSLQLVKLHQCDSQQKRSYL